MLITLLFGNDKDTLKEKLSNIEKNYNEKELIIQKELLLNYLALGISKITDLDLILSSSYAIKSIMLSLNLKEYPLNADYLLFIEDNHLYIKEIIKK